MSRQKREPGGVSRREFLTASAVGALGVGLGASLGRQALAAGPGPTPGGGESRPYNVLFIVTDEEHYLPKLPAGMNARARLQKQGVSFTNHYASSVMCTSARSGLFSGLHTLNNGMLDNTELPWQPAFDPRLHTVGKAMRQLGYYTVAKGKWHLSRDVDVYSPMHPPSKAQLGRRFDDFLEPYGFSDWMPDGDRVGWDQQGYEMDQDTASAAVTWLRRERPAIEAKGQPWFMYVGFINPHDVMYFNADREGKAFQTAGFTPFPVRHAPMTAFYENNWDVRPPASWNEPLDAPGRPRAHAEYFRMWNQCMGPVKPDAQHWQRFLNYYYNCLADVDRSVDTLLNELDVLDLWRDTIVVFVSDHGELAGSHGGLRHKGPAAYEQNIHVPLYIAHPEGARGAECRAVTSHVDLLPTLVGLSGASSEKRAEASRVSHLVYGPQDRAGSELPGNDFAYLVHQPKTATPAELRGHGALFTADQRFTLDADWMARVVASLEKGEKPGASDLPSLQKRGLVRTVFDGRYKFSRYFAPVAFNTPQSLDVLYSSNDVELFDLQEDPDELRNLAADRATNAALITQMNEKLNFLIAAEIFGGDQGQAFKATSKATGKVKLSP